MTSLLKHDQEGCNRGGDCPPPWELEVFEELRGGISQAYLRAGEHGDTVLLACMRAHHGAANRAIERLGGAAVPLSGLESLAELPNVQVVRSFLLEKWRERALVRGSEAPVDLTNACKFCTLFVQAIWGGEIRGNYHHQYNFFSGVVFDVCEGASGLVELEALGVDPTVHDELFWGNPEHVESMESCAPRVKEWVADWRLKHGGQP